LQQEIDNLVIQISKKLAEQQKEDFFNREKSIEAKYAALPDSKAKAVCNSQLRKKKLAKQKRI